MLYPVLSVKELSYVLPHHHAQKPVLDNVSFDVMSNEINTLIGPNGSGKSTLIKLMMGLLIPTKGSITKKKGLKIGYMPQKLELNPFLPLRVKDFLKLYGVIDEKMTTLLKVDRILNHSMHYLSNGEKQRVLFARTLMNSPDLLILDEPTQGVDVSGQNDFYEILLSIKARFNCSIFLVSHDLHCVLSATDHVICLNNHICCYGKPDEVTQHAEYQRLFGASLQPAKLVPYQHHHDHCHDLACDHVHNGETPS